MPHHSGTAIDQAAGQSKITVELSRPNAPSDKICEMFSNLSAENYLLIKLRSIQLE